MAVVLALLAGCGREKVTDHAGVDGFWHLERARTSWFWGFLNRFGFIRSHLADHGYEGERWWYVSPKGARTFLRVVNGVAPDARDADGGTYLPKAMDQAAGWGFNGLGYGVDTAGWLPRADTMPAIMSLSLDKWSGGLTQGVFDAWYAPSVAKACEGLAGTLKDAKPVAGVLWEAQPIASPRALLLAYAALGADSLSKKKLVTYVRDQCRGDVKLLQARIPSARSFDDLLARTTWDQYEAIDADAEGFSRLVYAAYGGRVQQEVRDRFPNFLNLGPLLPATLPVPVIQALAAYVDVLTFSVRSFDGRVPRRYLEDVYQATGKPIFVLDDGARLGETAGTPEGQAKAYRRGASGAAALPFTVGFGWSGWRDAPGDAGGLLDGTGAPREPLVKAAHEVNPALDARHREAAALPDTAEWYDSDRFAVPRPTQAIGRVPAAFTVDGDLSDWPANALFLHGMKLEDDLDEGSFAAVRVGWNDKGLAVGVEVQDDAVDQATPAVYWHEGDFVELFVDGSGRRADGYGNTALHLALLPRGGGADGRSALVVAVHHDGDAVTGTATPAAQVLVASNLAKVLAAGTPAGPLPPRARLAGPAWTVEALVPWGLLGVAPRAETRIGFNLIVHRQGAARADGAYWAILRGESGLDHPSTWGDLTLREAGE